MLRNCILLFVSLLFAPCVFAQQTADAIHYQDNQVLSVEKALSNFETIAETQRLLLGENNPAYATSLNDIGYCHSILGDYNKALEYHRQAAEIRKSIFGENHPDFATSLNNIGGCYSKLGDYGKALEYHRQAAEIRRSILGEDHPDYAASLNNIGGCYSDLGNYGKALEAYQQSSDIIKSALGENHQDFAISINNIGYCHSRLGDFGKAIEYYQQSSEILKSLNGESHPDYATTINNIGYCHSRLGDYRNALRLYEKSLDIRKSFLGEHHPDCVAPLRGIGICELNLNDYESASDIFNQFYSLLTTNILNDFGYLTHRSRIKYWDMYSPYFQYQLPALSMILQSIPSFLQTAYDGAIFSKGLLLNAETEMRDLILESGDESILALYDRLCLGKQQLAKEYEKPIAERQMPTDSLAVACDSLERELIRKSKVFGDYTKNLRIRWTDVQSKLTDNDIAIEFLAVPMAKDGTKYCALTLRKGYDAPHFVELFDLRDFKALSKTAGTNTIYGNPKLYNLVWKPLEKEIGDCANIYFGASGVLYQTAIEYADTGNGPLSEQKNIYRLSSTRQLATTKETSDLRTASIYGGLQYGTSMETLVADSRKYPSRSMDDDIFFCVDSLDMRGLKDGLGADDLPATLAEANDIADKMDKARYEESLTTGEEGTEASFKALSGQRRKIIHVATHGFYWTGEEAEKIGRMLGRLELMESGNDNRIREDKSLSRSGLLFSGANNALKQGYRKMDGVNDGILTAREIAGMDLRGTDLVVLSACQTGLGEVSGEGVFGLQRGFKKAGVNALMMSLWKVDDEATSMLMREFYDNYLAKGMDLQHSLHEAQKTVREYECEVEVEQDSQENGESGLLIDRLNNRSENVAESSEVKKIKTRKFQNPRYWAGFVLLDAID